MDTFLVKDTWDHQDGVYSLVYHAEWPEGRSLGQRPPLVADLFLTPKGDRKAIHLTRWRMAVDNDGYKEPVLLVANEPVRPITLSLEEAQPHYDKGIEVIGPQIREVLEAELSSLQPQSESTTTEAALKTWVVGAALVWLWTLLSGSKA